MKDSIEHIYEDMRLSPIEYLVKYNIYLPVPMDNGYSDSDFSVLRHSMKKDIENRVRKLLA